jgi:hypothetical protein
MITHHRQTLPLSQNFVTSQSVVLFGTSLSGYALLNASRTAANDFDEKKCLRMNTWSACKYIMYAPSQLLCNWHEQQPNNQGDLDSSVMGEVGESIAWGWTCF